MSHTATQAPFTLVACLHDNTGRDCLIRADDTVVVRCLACGAQVQPTIQAENEVYAHVLATREQRKPGIPF